MQEFENNAYFWQKIDTLYLSGDFRIAHKKGERHPKNKSLVFPVDYGYIKTLNGEKEESIAVYRGTKNKKPEAIVVCADILTKVIEAKLLVGLSESEEDELLRFLNATDIMKTLIVRRGKDIPSWAVTE